MKKFALTMATILLFYAPFGSTSSVWAGCKSDCRDQYESEVESCKSTYDAPEDSDDLSMCIDNAKDEYNGCIEECEN